MKAPQIIFLSIALVDLLITANKHGQPRSDTNFWETALGLVLTLLILFWGGFFS